MRNYKCTCPVCGFECHEDTHVTFKVGMDKPKHAYYISTLPISAFRFCPTCFFKDLENPQIVVMVRSRIKITHIPALTELGEYVDLPIDGAGKIDWEKFEKSNLMADESDDCTSTWGGAGPDCITGRREAA